jgi:murein DD-endopeptidase MepM/ murein hydrolase activator NlpD
MENELKNKTPLLERLRETYYRLVIMNHDTFEEIGSYKLSLMNFYVLISSLFVGISILIFTLIVFTPLKRYIPGYGSGTGDRKVQMLVSKVDDLEKQVKAYETYTNNFKSLLTNNVQNSPNETVEKVDIPDSLLNVKPTPEDQQLREAVASGAVVPLAVSTTPKKLIVTGSGKGSLEQMYLIAPLKGQISAAFSPKQKHNGLDIIAPKNTPVKAMADGYITFSDWTLETGNTIAVQHAGNVVSYYKHNSVLLKHAGDKINAGEAIAIIGNTGELTNGPHLHFEIWKSGRAVNPAEYLSF